MSALVERRENDRGEGGPPGKKEAAPAKEAAGSGEHLQINTASVVEQCLTRIGMATKWTLHALQFPLCGIVWQLGEWEARVDLWLLNRGVEP